MAEIAARDTLSVSTRGIPAGTQLTAVAWLRWRMFVNNIFRRRPTGTHQAVGLAFAILLRLIVWPFLALMVVGPVAGSGFLAWIAIAEGHPQTIAPLLAGIAILWQFVSINGLNIAAAVSSFDPASLTRFPLRFGRYLVLRTLLGLLTSSTIVGCLALLAATVGISLAKPALALPAVIVLAVYALMNIFLTRMIGAWMERWLANRRFREIFGLLMALFAVGIQFLSFQRASMRIPGTPDNWFLRFLHGSGPYLHWLPPGFAANAILLAPQRPAVALAQFTGLLASTALFAAVFAIRLHRQFLGEHLSEGVSRRTRANTVTRGRALSRQPDALATQARLQPSRAAFPPVVGACLRKEWLMLRGNGAQVIKMFTPLIFVVVFSGGGFGQHSTYLLPGAIAYVLFGLLAGLYNIFGADGLGVQLYLLAPIRMRDVILAKNLMSLGLIAVEAGLAWAAVAMLTRTPIPLSLEISTALWTIFVIAVNLALGTLRSIQAPHRFVPSQVRQRSTPTNRTSGLLIFLVLFGSMILQVPVMYLSHSFHEPWLTAWVFGLLASAAIAADALLLRNADRFILAHRDVFAEILCKI
ncbi:MAG: hypothetical protein ABSG10_13675 [Terracidiphilus sp.]|jgi:ABC-2 type transport system permease protein